VKRKQLRVNSILLISSIAVFAYSSAGRAKGPDTLWTKTYGGFSSDGAYSVQETADSGFIIAGDTESFGAEGGDIYLLKTDAAGDTVWSKIYGGERYDGARSVIQTFPDSGYIIAGTSHSYGRRYSDVLLLKTDAAGDTLWMRTYFDGLSHQRGECVRQTRDGGYVVVGATGPDYGALTDAYVVRTDPNGDTLWVRQYGYLEGGIDHAYSVVEVASGGFAIVGEATVVGKAGAAEAVIGVYLVRIDSGGDLLWQRTYAALESNCGYSIDEAAEGGFIIAGTTTPSYPGLPDIYLIRTDANGDSVWTRTYGGSGYDFAYSVEQTADGNYILGGVASSWGAGGNDVFVMQVNDEGKALWARTFGGAGDDLSHQIQQTSDGGFIVAGSTKSYGRGYGDVYVLKLAPTPADPVEPDLAIGVLQNPYMTQYLDIYLAASEELDSASVEMKVDGDSIGIHLLDPDGHLWRADYKVEPPGGVLSIWCGASDLADNDTTVSAEFVVRRFPVMGGGTVWSPDGRVCLRGGGGAMKHDVYAVILPCSESVEVSGSPQLVLRQGFHMLAPAGSKPAGYYIGPAAALTGGAYVEFSYGAADMPPGVSADQLCINANGNQWIESYFDETRQTVGAVISDPGVFSLALGEPGAGKALDSFFLDISRGFPNPFSESTVVRYEVRSSQRVKIEVYDVLGRSVARLYDNVVYPGNHEVVWDGRSQAGGQASSGFYFIRVATERGSSSTKVNLAR
jgi:hypothetical protein